MALIKCIECGNNVSDQAEYCPKCGCPVELKITCYECGESYLTSSLSCPKCGAPNKTTYKYFNNDQSQDRARRKEQISGSQFNLKNYFLKVLGISLLGIIILILFSRNKSYQTPVQQTPTKKAPTIQQYYPPSIPRRKPSYGEKFNERLQDKMIDSMTDDLFRNNLGYD